MVLVIYVFVETIPQLYIGMVSFFSSESREANPELTNAEPKKNTKLRATTEPFIPTSQKIFENPSLVSNGIIGDHGATAKVSSVLNHLLW